MTLTCAASRLVLNVLASVSQWEREAIGERTTDALRHKQAQGEYIGGEAPYGFRLEGVELVPDGGEQAVIAEARKLHAAGPRFAPWLVTFIAPLRGPQRVHLPRAASQLPCRD